MSAFHRDLCQIDKEWLKGRLQESVVTDTGEVVAITAENAEMAELIAKLLTEYYKVVAENQ